jgi:HAD superfamily hydrolase (TIGR01509 family)
MIERIKLIIFDLDGTLIETRDMHFNVLNDSLRFHGLEEISYKDHLNKYNGLSTATKLKMLEIDDYLAKSINSKKQEFTALYMKTIPKDENILEIITKLKEMGIIICIASNSIGATILNAMEQLEITEYVDYYVSNEDVSRQKPNAEMFFECMSKYDIEPSKTLIVEDSLIGICSAIKSGAHILTVKNPSELSMELINSKLNFPSKIIQVISKINVVIPMAGYGSRFSKAGYTLPKPLIDVNGNPMISLVIENLVKIKELCMNVNFIFLVQKEHVLKYNISDKLYSIVKKLGYINPIDFIKIIEVDGVTQGAACTVLLASEYINNNERLIIANSDQFVEWNPFDFLMNAQKSDACISCFKGSGTKWSYAKIDENKHVTNVAEKVQISNLATTGIYFWKRGSDFIKYANQMISKNVRTNNEFYVCPVFNEAIEDGLKVGVHMCDKFHSLGTPEDLGTFIQTSVLSNNDS